MNCPFCNGTRYHLFTQYIYKEEDELPIDAGKVYKACLDCNMRTGYYSSQAELKEAEDRNPFKRADW